MVWWMGTKKRGRVMQGCRGWMAQLNQFMTGREDLAIVTSQLPTHLPSAEMHRSYRTTQGCSEFLGRLAARTFSLSECVSRGIMHGRSRCWEVCDAQSWSRLRAVSQSQLRILDVMHGFQGLGALRPRIRQCVPRQSAKHGRRASASR